MSAEVVSAFAEFLHQNGLEPEEVVADGEIHRCRRTGKDKWNRDGSYCLFIDAAPAGWCENHQTGNGVVRWSYAGKGNLDQSKVAAMIEANRQNAAAKEKARLAKAAEAATQAKERFDAAGPPDPAHPYLVRKGVEPFGGIRQERDLLLLPMRNTKGELVSVQTIDPSGVKRFTQGAKISGAYLSIGRVTVSRPVLLICEGYATGATIHEATGLPVAVAFDCGNIEKVATLLREKYPNLPIAIAGDDDYKTEGNPGAAHANKTATKVGGPAIFPGWFEGDERGTDWNDLHKAYGIEEVKRQMKTALATVMASAELHPEAKPAPKPGEPWTPEGYHHTNGRTYRIKTDQKGEPHDLQIAPAVVWLTGISRDLTTDEHALVLEWYDGSIKRRISGRRGVCMSARRLVELAEFGFPVSSETAGEMVRFISTAEAEFKEANIEATIETVSVCGWHGDTEQTPRSFLFGTHQLGIAPRLEIRDPHLLSGIKRLTPKGDQATWARAAQTAINHSPDLAILLAAAVASPLLRLLSVRPFVVDICGQTSAGKTQALRFAASCVGSPDDIWTWDTTRYALSVRSDARQGISLFLDESQRQTDRMLIHSTIYDLTTGEAKAQGNPNEAIRRIRRYESIVISTGEESLPNFSPAGGTRARCLTLWGPPWGKGGVKDRIGSEWVEKQSDLSRVTRYHHGHAALAIAKRLVAISPAELQTLRDQHHAATTKYTMEAQNLSPGNQFADRLAEYVGVLEVAGSLLTAEFGITPTDGWVSFERWGSMLEHARGADVAKSAMDSILSWALRRTSLIKGHPDSEKAPMTGWIGAMTHAGARVALIASAVKEELTKQGYHAEAITRSWADRGWLLTENKRSTRAVSIAGANHRCFVFTDEIQSEYIIKQAPEDY